MTVLSGKKREKVFCLAKIEITRSMPLSGSDCSEQGAHRREILELTVRPL
jgi:hypothetical protein